MLIATTILTLTVLIEALISLTVMSNAYCSLKKMEQYFLGRASWAQTGSHREGELGVVTKGLGHGCGGWKFSDQYIPR